VRRDNGLARQEYAEDENIQVSSGPKSKPRYSDDENEMIYENWWNPKLRKELSRRFGRKISALRSQFCRILKEKGISNTDYYKIMRAKYQTQTPKELLADDEDQLILEIFAKHQVLGGTRNEACNELQRILKKKISEAALKLRFYRLMQKKRISEEQLIQIGQDILIRSGIKIPDAPILQGEPVYTPQRADHDRETSRQARSFRKQDHKYDYDRPGWEQDALRNEERAGKVLTGDSASELTGGITGGISIDPDSALRVDKKHIFNTAEVPESEENKSTFLYQLAHLPETIQLLEERVESIESAQKRQLDLRGFIEHLLAVERDLKTEEKLLKEIDHLVDENNQLLEKLEKEKGRLSKREQELSEIYGILNSMLNEFMHLESVAKLASLGDFIHRLEITVDQFGNVLNSRRVQGA